MDKETEACVVDAMYGRVKVCICLIRILERMAIKDYWISFLNKRVREISFL